MKKFVFDEFNKEGQEFLSVEFRFDIVDGLRFNFQSYSVDKKRLNVSPYSDCDFVGNGSSMSSKNFFEVSGLKTPNNLYFSPDSNFNLREYYLVLPENKELFVEKYTDFINSFINENILTIEQKLQKLKEFS